MSSKFQISSLCFLLFAACAHVIPGSGLEELYTQGREAYLSGKAGDIDKAVVALEAVAREEPTYRDTLTLLSRAYYRQERYRDANTILKRAVAVNKGDGVAWLAFGLTQLRLGEDEKGLESLNRGTGLLDKASVPGYHNYPNWDSKGLIRAAIERTGSLAAKGVQEKKNLILSGDTLLIRIDDEENFQRSENKQEYRRVYTGNR